MPRLVFAFQLGVVVLAFAGCGATSDTGGTITQSPPQGSPPSGATTAPAAPRHHRASHRAVRGPAVGIRRWLGLVYSTASNEVVQSQPGPGSCHAIGSR